MKSPETETKWETGRDLIESEKGVLGRAEKTTGFKTER